MQEKDVLECLNMMNNKKCEGFDRIPVCIITAAKPAITSNLINLFQKIYSTSKVPD